MCNGKAKGDSWKGCDQSRGSDSGSRAWMKTWNRFSSDGTYRVGLFDPTDESGEKPVFVSPPFYAWEMRFMRTVLAEANRYAARKSNLVAAIFEDTQ